MPLNMPRNPMPFGKYGPDRPGGALDMDDVPASYLDWLRGQDWLAKWPAVAEYIKAHKKSIDKQLEEALDLSMPEPEDY